MESAFINATIITELVLESGPVLARPTGPVPPALYKVNGQVHYFQLNIHAGTMYTTMCGCHHTSRGS